MPLADHEYYKTAKVHDLKMSVAQSSSSSSSDQTRVEPPYPLHKSVRDRIDPAYAEHYEQHVANQQQVHLQPVEASRTSGTLIKGAGPKAPVASTVDCAIPRQESDGPEVSVRAFTPNGKAPEAGWPLCFWFHGGGWVLGDITTENVIASNLCSRGRCVVVSVDYRLAPEHPYPAAVEDCWEAVLWALGQGAKVLGIDPSKLAAGGSSAGGNLTAIMCQRAAAAAARGESGGPKFMLQLLSVPVMDNTADPSCGGSWKENRKAPALPAPKMLWYREHYLPDRAHWADPEASPLRWQGDWALLPPAVIVVGELDVLRDEGRAFGERLREAKVRADVHTMKGQPHPFIAMDGVLTAGKEAITLFCDALEETMYPGSRST
ncbi:Alpha/Beta hydrolase protein [Xylariaceae sp. FL0804]|nr:Alpha/Beta hydrolase protein [Xylariaceae sp. FL0804]